MEPSVSPSYSMEPMMSIKAMEPAQEPPGQCVWVSNGENLKERIVINLDYVSVPELLTTKVV